MNDLLVGLLSALVATNTPQAVSNLVQQKTGISVPIPDPNDPVEKAYQKVLAEDDQALAEIARWREESAKLGGGADKASAVAEALLNNRIRQRATPVRQSYEAFLQAHPKHSNGRVAYAAFLAEIGDEEAGGQELERAVEADGTNPAALNNLANYYGHNGRVERAFGLYDRAMKIDPTEPLYCENLATTVFLFRSPAMAHYKISEKEVYAKALGLYRKALDLDPSFDRAVELAKTYYGIKPVASDDAEARREAEKRLAADAYAAWEMAYKLATSDEERQGVRLHFARWRINAKRFVEARRELDAVTSDTYSAGRQALLKRLEKESAPEPVPDPAKP